ncbi:HlyD family efflux transporter periplasmic adaptor subunit [Mucilaginibacter sp. KACC 22773]|uniref:HlyD family secretion protein n=1 Tax=Mucilaginibacter sp. KACC 22773 TaxID=3025671 RepID=UPI002365CD58|nr:HlyD family efflux transporter periplasmic adaptor subunit [Mucilaginibacter sp. KACC 22773]WDF80740.1 HlyD family efflux transporter periplasmic adaptor subunit [Mucilaginibacter sp. KACC 22773]
MPISDINSTLEARHTDDIQDIITTVPSWLLRWGIAIFFIILVLIVGLAAIIRYPDIVKTQLKIDSPNSPKAVVSKVPGKLVKLLVSEGQEVTTGEPLAYLESTAHHKTVLQLLTVLKRMQHQLLNDSIVDRHGFNRDEQFSLGELQSGYQVFMQEYLNYQSAVKDGFFLQKRDYLKKDLTNLNEQRSQLNAQKDLEQKDYLLAGQEYEMHKKLEHEKVETIAEFRQAESKYLAKKSPLIQTEASLISAAATYASKQKEILELDNQIREEKTKFSQALNSLISQADDWKSKYILSASQSGIINYAGIVQENEVLNVAQEVFYIDSQKSNFFGIMSIPQTNMGKVKEGQEVLVKLKGFPYEQYGIMHGHISFIAAVPYKDSVFISRVNFPLLYNTDMKKVVHLKQGMLADAEIITEDATVLQRITHNLRKMAGPN